MSYLMPIGLQLWFHYSVAFPLNLPRLSRSSPGHPPIPDPSPILSQIKQAYWTITHYYVCIDNKVSTTIIVLCSALACRKQTPSDGVSLFLAKKLL